MRGWKSVATVAAATVLAAATGANAWNVGASSRTIIPTVNGTTDFWSPVPDTDASSPGTLVVEWDVGRLSVGNGGTQSHWVRDDIRTSAVAIEDDDGIITVFSSTEGMPGRFPVCAFPPGKKVCRSRDVPTHASAPFPTPIPHRHPHISVHALRS